MNKCTIFDAIPQGIRGTWGNLTCLYLSHSKCQSHLRVPVELEAPLSGVVDGEGRAVGALPGTELGALGGDAGRRVVRLEGVLRRRPQEVPSGLLVGEDAAVAGTWGGREGCVRKHSPCLDFYEEQKS